MAPSSKYRLNELGDMLCPVGGHQERLGSFMKAGGVTAQQQRSNLSSNPSAAGLACLHSVKALGKQLDLSALTAAFTALKNYEPTSRHDASSLC
jgi:hypothetical protein